MDCSGANSPVSRPPHLMFHKMKWGTHVDYMSHEGATPRTLDPIVSPDVTLWVDEVCGSLYHFELQEKIVLIVGRLCLQSVQLLEHPDLFIPCTVQDHEETLGPHKYYDPVVS